MNILEAAAKVKETGASPAAITETMRLWLWLYYADTDDVLFHDGKPWAIKIGPGKAQLF